MGAKPGAQPDLKTLRNIHTTKQLASNPPVKPPWMSCSYLHSNAMHGSSMHEASPPFPPSMVYIAPLFPPTTPPTPEITENTAQ